MIIGSTIVVGTRSVPTTLVYGQRVEKTGSHVMETPPDQPTETLTDLGTIGVNLVTAHIVVPIVIVYDGVADSSVFGLQTFFLRVVGICGKMVLDRTNLSCLNVATMRSKFCFPIAKKTHKESPER